jgi:hypothetical protein
MSPMNVFWVLIYSAQWWHRLQEALESAEPSIREARPDG